MKTHLYDLGGNRTQQAIGKATTSYTFGAANNRLLTASTKATVSTYSYDSDGSRVADGPASYVYDVFERIRTGTGPNGSMTYVYNGFGQRIVKYGVAILDNDGDPATTTPGYSATYFVYDEVGRLIGEYGTKGKPREETVYLGDMPIAVIKPTGVYFVHSDYRNMPRQIDNSLKAAVWAWDPRGFGDSNPKQNLSGTTFVYKLRFPGQYFDGETLKNYNYFRTYDFDTGRYLESDPIGLAGGLNTYAYVKQSPITNMDRFGLQAAIGTIRLLCNMALAEALNCVTSEECDFFAYQPPWCLRLFTRLFFYQSLNETT
jgi:RHS repeat-associated protein